MGHDALVLGAKNAVLRKTACVLVDATAERSSEREEVESGVQIVHTSFASLWGQRHSTDDQGHQLLTLQTASNLHS